MVMKNSVQYKSLQKQKHIPQNMLYTPQLKHILTGEELSIAEIENLLLHAQRLKKERKRRQFSTVLANYHLALIFTKPSFRTRFSFTIAMRELGGDVVESVESTRKMETPEDQVRVLNGYCDA